MGAIPFLGACRRSGLAKPFLGRAGVRPYHPGAVGGATPFLGASRRSGGYHSLFRYQHDRGGKIYHSLFGYQWGYHSLFGYRLVAREQEQLQRRRAA